MPRFCLPFRLQSLLCLSISFLCAQPVDLSRTIIVTAENLTAPERLAVDLVQDEVEQRTGVRWAHSTTWPDSGPVVVLEQRGAVKAPAQVRIREPKPLGPEGFSIETVEDANPVVWISGQDTRGVLFGAGCLLRKLEMRRNQALLPAPLTIATVPETRLRGHQLGYRPKTNSYDAWTLPMWEQYVRDLIVFGTNAIELIPPRSDDDDDSPHFPKPQIDVMVGMSRMLDDYGLDVWIWYPAMDEDYSNPETVQFALKEWGDVFQRLKRVDAVLVPAGDPGHTPAPILMPFLDKQAANLRKHHPKAQLWLAPQGFDAESIDYFFEHVNRRPAWLEGIVFGPQTRISLPELRRRLAPEIPIRHYPDITHTVRSQYPVQEWDVAFAITEHREPINPRPEDYAAIFRTQQKHTIGFIAYSEGINDDVNKIVWSGLGWKQSAPVIEILRDYSRYFIGPDFEEGFAQGLLGLERNWRGPALTNDSIAVTLAQFQQMERRAAPALRANWRFQQGLYRAYYDAYVHNRLLYEQHLEESALSYLRRASAIGSLTAMRLAEQALERTVTEPSSPDLRARIFELAEALYNSIRMQLSVPRYQAISVGRGANLDLVDEPLNNRLWLGEQFTRIRRLDKEEERLRELERLADWRNPGPGGFYDDLGNIPLSSRLQPGEGFATDPSYFHTPLVFFDGSKEHRLSWRDQVIGLYEQPVEMEYRDLDPKSRYRVRVVYGAGPVRLHAGDVLVHDYITKPFEPLEFALPADAAKSGILRLRWNRPPGGGGAGRGCQIAEVWLERMQ